MFVLLKSLLQQKSCFDEKFVSLSKSLFCRKVCFFEKFFSRKSFFRKKVFFVENFVPLIDFCQMVTFYVFLAETNVKFHPEVKYVGISKIRQESSGLWPFF